MQINILRLDLELMLPQNELAPLVLDIFLKFQILKNGHCPEWNVVQNVIKYFL